MKSLGANHGTTSHINDLKVMYMLAYVVHDENKMKKALDAISRSKYAESTKNSAYRFLKKWESSR